MLHSTRYALDLTFALRYWCWFTVTIVEWWLFLLKSLRNQFYKYSIDISHRISDAVLECLACIFIMFPSLNELSYGASTQHFTRLDAISATNSPVYLSFFYNFISAYGCKSSWWRHQMETFPTSLTLCAGNSPVTGEFPSQRPVTRRFDVSLDLRLNKPLSKQSKRRWFETPSCSLWHHCNVLLHDATFFTMQSSINFPKRSDAYLR